MWNPRHGVVTFWRQQEGSTVVMTAINANNVKVREVNLDTDKNIIYIAYIIIGQGYRA